MSRRMSAHWKPDERAARPLRQAKRLKPLGDAALRDLVERAQRVERQLPSGSKAGLVLVAAACVLVGIGLYQMFGPRQIVAPGEDSGWSEPGEPAGR
jgi:hypothetical protein